jgi:hypothetical protein
MLMRPYLLALIIICRLGLPGGRALACASCGCGDPTLTTMGVEIPFRNRVRLALEQRVGGHRTGLGPGEEEDVTARTSLLVSYSPARWVTLGAMLPGGGGQSSAPGGLSETRRRYGLGDLELLARFLPFRDRSFAPRHVAGLLVGLKVPTGPRVSDSSGYPAPDDRQPGTGSWDPIFGAGYSYFGEDLSVFATINYRLATPGPRATQRGSVLGASVVAQRALGLRLAVALGVDVGYTAADQFPDGAPLPQSGGVVVALTPGLLIQPRTDFLLRLAVQVPVAQAWSGEQHEYPTGILAGVVDL